MHGRPEPHLQTPPMHVSVVPVHVLPHSPQLAGSAETSMHAPPQHASPSGHGAPVVPHWQTPSRQVSPGPHARPQSPQLAGSTDTLEHRSTQHCCPVRQADDDPHMHLPPAGPGPQAFASGISQRLPQNPQLLTSVVVFVHVTPQQFGLVPPQGGEHAGATQTPLRQSLPASHVAPQRPQFRTSVRVSTHVVPQHSRPAAHPPGQAVPVQTPPEHPTPSGHLFPHRPQFSRSRLRITQVPPQQVWPNEHVLSPHRHSPPTQLPSPHELPQYPQLFRSPSRSTQRSLQHEAVAHPSHAASAVAHECARTAKTAATLGPANSRNLTFDIDHLPETQSPRTLAEAGAGRQPADRQRSRAVSRLAGPGGTAGRGRAPGR